MSGEEFLIIGILTENNVKGLISLDDLRYINLMKKNKVFRYLMTESL